MFEELYNSSVTDEDKQSTVEEMATEMQEKWDPTTDFDVYTNRQDERREVTDKCGDRATDAQMIRRSLPSMEAVPVLASAVTEWKKKAAADKTWANFKQHFKDELKHMKSGKQKLASLGLVNEVQELKNQLAAYVAKDKERTQELSLLCQAVQEGFREIANETKENTNPNPPAPSTDSELTTLLREILQNTSTTALTGNKKQRTNPKGQVAFRTPPEQTTGAVCTKVDGHDKWTATIMNTHPNVNKEEERQWCQPCGRWYVKNFNNHWTGTHKDWQLKEKAKTERIYKAKMKELE